jgi:hypothetical protein
MVISGIRLSPQRNGIGSIPKSVRCMRYGCCWKARVFQPTVPAFKKKIFMVVAAVEDMEKFPWNYGMVFSMVSPLDY